MPALRCSKNEVRTGNWWQSVTGGVVSGVVTGGKRCG